MRDSKQNPAHRLDRSVVGLVSEHSNGTALYLGTDGKKFFFITALHVLQNRHSRLSRQWQTDEAPSFHFQTGPRGTATLLKRFADIDLAILSTEHDCSTLRPVVFSSNGLATKKQRPISQVVACRSRSGSVELHSIEGAIQSGGDIGSHIQLGGGAPPGFSGGGLFQNDGTSWLCAGLTLLGGAGAATSSYFKSEFLIKILNGEKLPCETGQLSSIRRKPTTLSMKGSALALVVTAAAALPPQKLSSLSMKGSALALVVFSAVTAIALIFFSDYVFGDHEERSRAYRACVDLRGEGTTSDFQTAFQRYYKDGIVFIRKIADVKHIGDGESQREAVLDACCGMFPELESQVQ